MRAIRWFKRKFFSRNFLKYLLTGVLFTLLNVSLVWLFVDFIIMFPKEYNTPVVTFIIIFVLFVSRYLVFQWIGFTRKD